MAVLVGALQLRDVGVAAQVLQDLKLPLHILYVLLGPARNRQNITRRIPSPVLRRPLPCKYQPCCMHDGGVNLRTPEECELCSRGLRRRRVAVGTPEPHTSFRFDMDLQTNVFPVARSVQIRVVPKVPRPSNCPSAYEGVMSCTEHISRDQ